MRARRLALAAVVGLAALPFSGAIAAPSGLNDLPQALADPIEPGLVEITSSSSGELVGYFDAGAFAQWAGTDASSRQAFRDMLTSREFVSGYQRIWSTNDHEALFETVFVFRAASDADSMNNSVNGDFTTSSNYKGVVSLTLNDTSWAGQEIVGGFHWTAAGFTRANDAFLLYRGSDADFRTTAALAQAREMYTVAPDGTSLATPVRQQSAFSRFLAPVVITLVVGVLLMLTAVVIAVVVTVIPRGAQATPSRP